MTCESSETINNASSGGVTETSTYLYGNGSGKSGGLLVLECKKRRSNEKPYMVTVAYYYATSTARAFSNKDVKIGHSLVAKVRSMDEYRRRLDYVVEGPLQYPAAALFYMFDQVIKTGIWKPTACPHCADTNNNNNYKSFVEKQRKILWHSESDDDIDNAGGVALSIVGNHGAITGNGNGNLIIKNLNKLSLAR